MASAESLVKDLLKGLDDDLKEYVYGVMDDMDPEERATKAGLSEVVGPFLLSSGFVSDEKGADDICAKLAAKFGGLKVADAPKEPWPMAVNEAPIKIDEAASAGPVTGRLAKRGGTNLTGMGGSDQLFSSTKGNKMSKEEKKNQKDQLATLAKFQRENTELEKELEDARTHAAKLRASEGAFLGTIEVKQFTLPNPGGGENLINEASFSLVPGRRYGLIGRNGKGKSTLLRWMGARRVGQIPAAVTVHYVSQDVSLTAESLDRTPVDIVLEADVERHMLEVELKDLEKKGVTSSLENEARVMKIQERLQEIDAHSARTRVLALLANLGFSEEMVGKKMRDMSGGWRVRTALAAAVFSNPDVLCLDEPTNHLSIAAVMWLAHELKTNEKWSKRIIVIVSHDRIFLDDVCTDTLHISGAAHRLTASPGNYSMWAKRRAEQQKTLERVRANRAEVRATLLEYTQHGFRYGGSSSQINMMQAKVKQIAKLDEEAAAESDEWAALAEDADLPLKINAGGLFDGFALQLQDVGFKYGSGDGPLLFRHAEFTVDTKSRIVLLGENGNGKTTLLKLMLEEVVPTEGKVVINRGARFALVNQHHADQLDMAQTPLQYMRSKYPGDGSYAHDQSLRSALDKCGVGAILQSTLSSALSGGQRSRVALAAVSYGKPHILFLDEPTNNLDLEAVAALADCIEKFEGGVMLVSHDQYFVGRVAQEVWVVEAGKVAKCESFEIYRNQQFRKLNLK